MTRSHPIPLSLWLALAAFWGISAFTGSAEAYCRTTNCNRFVSCEENPNDCCKRDDFTGCEINGQPIAWPSACVSYNVQKNGSKLLGITAKELETVVATAFDTWLSVTCFNGGFPSSVSLSVDDRGLAECDRQEFNEGPKDRNANIWMFDDQEMGQDQSGGGMTIDATTLAFALISFNPITAEIYDADVQLNSGLAHFTQGEQAIDIDLQSVVTHEAGHFLGLDHSPIPGATMASGYTPGDIGPRRLEFDDKQGICDSYPQNRAITRTTCEPRGKYHIKCEDEGCDCRTSPGRGRGTTSHAWWTLALGALLILRRRARS